MKRRKFEQSYIDKGGIYCPFCQSENIEGSEWNADGGTATQEVSCNDCFKEWLDCYMLTGFLEVE